MKFKEKFLIFTICLLIFGIYLLAGKYRIKKDDINRLYSVYLDGENIGVIEDKESLYALINEKQQSIKDRYNVSNVYPPNGLQVVETYTYGNKIDSIDDIYNRIEESQEFSIKGYEVKISATDSHKEFSLYVLDKNVFNEAAKKFILAFISEEKYNDYLDGVQESLDDNGKVYDDMKLLENITFKEKYISTNEKVYENSDELAQELLFGFNYKEQSYTVKEGDTIESISEENTLNTQEFLIANPKYSSKDSLLAVGDKVNITLINPAISFSYTTTERKEVEKDFDTKIIRDNTKDSSYSEITTPGVKGLSVQEKKYTVINGEEQNGVDYLKETVIREAVTQVTTKGRKAASGGGAWGSQTYIDTGSGWRWPTSNPYTVTSEFAPRWGRYHNGIDISGSGFGSKIFAANDGVVVTALNGCADVGSYGSKCNGGFGNYVVIDHGDNIYTVYAHLRNTIPVRNGQTVSRGTVIGYMGSSGSSTGTHLHFGLSIGHPNQGGTYKNPRSLYK